MRVEFPVGSDNETSSKTFTLANHENIVEPNSKTTIFLGRHSEIREWVAVKTAKNQPYDKQSGDKLQVRSLAREYLNEVEVLRKIQHVRQNTATTRLASFANWSIARDRQDVRIRLPVLHDLHGVPALS